jgi:transposase
VKLVLRAKIVLAAAAGKLNTDIAVELKTVCQWRNRFAEKRLSGIERDAPRGGRPPAKRAGQAAEIIRMTTTEKPQAATHWSVRSLAKRLKIARSMVHRVWQANGLKPHRVKTFKLSNDPKFAEKLVDVVGLYLHPPDNAIVICVDEKSQIQALDRTQKGLPIVPGRCGTMTHDYRRHGTTTLFAGLIVADGRVIEQCLKRHRHQEFIKFLKHLDASTDPMRELHLIVDNYATHKHPTVKRWLAKHSRVKLHFTPTSSSWLNLVERWFRELTQKRIRRGTFRSVRELIAAIVEYVENHNEHAKEMKWTALPEEIMAKVRRARAVLDKTPLA